MKIKGIKRMLVASILACTTLLHAQAEESPSGYRNAWSYGFKLGTSVSSFRSLPFKDSVKDEWNKQGVTLENPFFANWGFIATLYVEYAFTNYLGAALEAGYMQQGGGVNFVDSTDRPNSQGKDMIKKTIHSITLPYSFYVYPLGRKEGKGVLKIGLGPTMFFRIGEGSRKIKYKQEGQLEVERTDKIPASDLSRFNLAVHFNIGYEWPFGVSLETRYGFGFFNMLSEKGKKGYENNARVPFKGELNGQYLAFSLGFNIASLFDI